MVRGASAAICDLVRPRLPRAPAITHRCGVHEWRVVSRSRMRLSTDAEGVSGPRGAVDTNVLGRGERDVTLGGHFA